jgi:hypothetical protein
MNDHPYRGECQPQSRWKCWHPTRCGPPESTIPLRTELEALLRDPRAAGRPWLPLQQMRCPRELLRVECRRCGRTIEIQHLDAVRLYGPHATWREVGDRLLDDGCRVRMTVVARRSGTVAQGIEEFPQEPPRKTRNDFGEIEIRAALPRTPVGKLIQEGVVR